MRFFLSAEVDILVHEHLRRVQNRVQARLTEFFADRDYGPAVKEIGVIPMVLRPEWRAGHRERRLFRRKQASADYRTWIDFDRMRDGPDEVRERLIVRNIVEAVADLSRKAGTGFAGDRLIADVLGLYGLTPSDLDAEDGVRAVAAEPGAAADRAGGRR